MPTRACISEAYILPGVQTGGSRQRIEESRPQTDCRQQAADRWQIIDRQQTASSRQVAGTRQQTTDNKDNSGSREQTTNSGHNDYVVLPADVSTYACSSAAELPTVELDTVDNSTTPASKTNDILKNIQLVKK
jgi:hypothetical protein